jgi:NADH:ubiquinone oxidoreductase subunit 3 (subunit A)
MVMDTINWFDIIGTCLGFVGSVVFSAALLKPQEQIRDENNSYWDGNPFTLRGELGTQPYYLVAMLLLIAGFAVSLGGKLSTQFASASVNIAILISSCITLAGFLAVALFYINRNRAHQKARIKWLRGIFINAARTYTDDMLAADEADNKSVEFERVKSIVHPDLVTKYKQIPEPYDEREKQLISTLSRVKTAANYRSQLEKYLSEIVGR